MTELLVAEIGRRPSDRALHDREGYSLASGIALGLIFLRTNCESVASRIVIPQNIFQLDFIRPDFAMLRLVARCLIMWDSIEASEAWVQNQLPSFLAHLKNDTDSPKDTSKASRA